MKQYLYRIHPTRPAMLTAGPTPREAAIVSEHFAYLQNLVEQGTVLMAGRTLNDDESTFGIVVFTSADDAAATALMQADPAVRQGVMHATLFPYRVALWSDKNPLAQD